MTYLIAFAIGGALGLLTKPASAIDLATFEGFSEVLSSAIVERDEARLRELMGPRLFTRENFLYATDTEYFRSFGSDRVAMREILLEKDVATIIEMVRVEGQESANVFFVSARHLRHRRPPLVRELESLSLMLDYAACQLEKVDGKVMFASHFCFAETD